MRESSRSPAGRKTIFRPALTRSLVLVIVALILPAAGGCREHDHRTNPDGHIPCDGPYCDPPSSPLEAVRILELTYVERNLDRYASLLAPDFTFFFSPPDSSLPDFPRSWGREEELASAEQLFRSEYVERIVLALNLGEPEPSPEVIPDSWRVQVRVEGLKIIRREATGQLDTLAVSRSTELFYLRPDPDQLTPHGMPVWYIVRWEDLSNAGADQRKAAAINWSYIKYLYRG